MVARSRLRDKLLPPSPTPEKPQAPPTEGEMKAFKPTITGYMCTLLTYEGGQCTTWTLTTLQGGFLIDTNGVISCLTQKYIAKAGRVTITKEHKYKRHGQEGQNKIFIFGPERCNLSTSTNSWK